MLPLAVHGIQHLLVAGMGADARYQDTAPACPSSLNSSDQVSNPLHTQNAARWH